VLNDTENVSLLFISYNMYCESQHVLNCGLCAVFSMKSICIGSDTYFQILETKYSFIFLACGFYLLLILRFILYESLFLEH